MGAGSSSTSSSKSVSQIINDNDTTYLTEQISSIITNVIMTQTSTCSVNSSTDVYIGVSNIDAAGNIDININNTTKSSFDITCLQSSTLTSSITDSLTSTIANAVASAYNVDATTQLTADAAADASNGALALAASIAVSDSSTDSETLVVNETTTSITSIIQNLVESNITESTVTQFIADITTRVDIMIDTLKAGGNVSITLDLDETTEAIIYVIQSSDSVSTLANELLSNTTSETMNTSSTSVESTGTSESSSSSSNEGILDQLSDMLSSYVTMIIAIVGGIIILIVIGIVIYFVTKSKGTTSVPSASSVSGTSTGTGVKMQGGNSDDLFNFVNKIHHGINIQNGGFGHSTLMSDLFSSASPY
jgi:hypothetical protein